MKSISKSAVAVLETLTRGLQPGESRKFGEAGGAIMPAVVECLAPNQYSVSHYYEANGDLVPDPDMEFYRAETGAWFPVAITMSSGYRSVALKIEDGKIKSYVPSALVELCSFTTMWMRNIRSQQGL